MNVILWIVHWIVFVFLFQKLTKLVWVQMPIMHLERSGNILKLLAHLFKWIMWNREICRWTHGWKHSENKKVLLRHAYCPRHSDYTLSYLGGGYPCPIWEYPCPFWEVLCPVQCVPHVLYRGGTPVLSGSETK